MDSSKNKADCGTDAKRVRSDCRERQRLPATGFERGDDLWRNLIAKIYHIFGILSKGQLVEVDRSGLVGGYVSHTALKVQDVVKEALGGGLFIDEAYSLIYRRSENDFGWEAVDTLIKAMEDYRDDLVVIVAGYPERMAEFIESNHGLKSRFNRYIEFENYTSDELFEIFKKMLAENGFRATGPALSYVKNWIKGNRDKEESSEEIFFGLKPKEQKTLMQPKDSSANARMVRNLLETSMINQADRLFQMDRDALNNKDLMTIELSDV